MHYLKLLLLTFCLLSTTGSFCFANSTLKSYTKNNLATIQEETNEFNDMYAPELNRVELFLFRKTYPNYSLNSRLSKIERTIFSSTYDNLTPAQRMNNILANYQLTKNYARSYYQTGPLAQRVYNRFLGYPTGITPPLPVMNYYPRVINDYYSNRGYSYNNSMPPMVGAGIKILD